MATKSLKEYLSKQNKGMSGFEKTEYHKSAEFWTFWSNSNAFSHRLFQYFLPKACMCTYYIWALKINFYVRSKTHEKWHSFNYWINKIASSYSKKTRKLNIFKLAAFYQEPLQVLIGARAWARPCRRMRRIKTHKPWKRNTLAIWKRQ